MFHKIINLIKLNFNNRIVRTKLLNSDLKFLKIFIKLNIIKNVKLIKNNNDNIYLIKINNKSAFKNLQNLYKPSKPVKINLKTIIKNNKNNKSIFYLTTVKGIINNIEAEKYKVGGILIFSISI